MRIVFNVQGFKQLRREDAVVAYEVECAQKVADAANAIGKGTYAVGSRQGAARPQGRWRTSVVTADAKAMAHNAKHQTLLKAMNQALGG